MSMFKKAERKQLRARVAFDGPSGAGKTMTALQWATVLGKRIAMIDTEHRSGSLYADEFSFDVCDFAPPYDPARLVKVLKAAETEYDVVIIDSLSHFWQGEGGVLEIVDAAAERARGNSYAGWKVGTPALQHLIDTILGLDAHIIATMRAKMEYVLEERNGKQVPRKVGMAPIMRNGIEFEFTVVGDIDLEHRMAVSKTRCRLLADKIIPATRATEHAELFRDWLDEGSPDDGETATAPPADDPTPATAPPAATSRRRAPPKSSTPAPATAEPAPDQPADDPAPAAQSEAAENGKAGVAEAREALDGAAPTWCKTIHTQAGQVAKEKNLAADALVDIVVWNVTGGRTTSTRELADSREAGRVQMGLRDVMVGQVTIEGDAATGYTLVHGDKRVTLETQEAVA